LLEEWLIRKLEAEAKAEKPGSMGAGEQRRRGAEEKRRRGVLLACPLKAGPGGRQGVM